MRLLAVSLALVSLALVGCGDDADGDAGGMEWPENPRNAAECGHGLSYEGIGASANGLVDVEAGIVANDSDFDQDPSNDLGNYRARFLIVIDMAGTGDRVASGEAAEVPVLCDGLFSAPLTSHVEPYDVIGSVDGTILADGASGTWEIETTDGSWSGTWDSDLANQGCLPDTGCPSGFSCEDRICEPS